MNKFIFNLQRFAQIYNYDSDTLLSGTSGNDTIENYASKITIDGGAGNDYIFNRYCSEVTISGGAGNDTIHSYGNYVLLDYAVGDGNDLVYGFDSTDSLQIGNGNDTFSKDTVDSDVVITVGENKITLFGVASTADAGELNIKGTEVFNYTWTFKNDTATYGKPNQILTEVKGVTSKDGLSINGKIVTVSKAALGTNNVTISNGYTLKLADDVAIPSSTEKWSYDNSTATLKRTTTEGYELSGDGSSISYYPTKNDTLLTVNGIKSFSGISLNGTTVTVFK